MKSGRLEACLSYIKFCIEAEGKEMTEEQSEFFADLLDGDLDISSVIADYEKRMGLERSNEGFSSPLAFYPNTRTRVNYYDIQDKDYLSDIDHAISLLRTAYLFVNPIKGEPNLKFIMSLHRAMFSDVYPSAGMFRIRSAAKRTEFAQPENIPSLMEDLFSRLKETDYLRKFEAEDSEDFINELAYFMGELEAIHPFADGNGRVIRFYITVLAERCGYAIDWATADPDQLLEASIAAIDGDYQALVNALEEIVYHIHED